MSRILKRLDRIWEYGSPVYSLQSHFYDPKTQPSVDLINHPTGYYSLIKTVLWHDIMQARTPCFTTNVNVYSRFL